MQQRAIRPWLTAGVAIAGAGVVAVTPVTAPLPGVQVADIVLTSGAGEITLDFVRHGQSTDNVAHIIGTVAPGAPLTAEGQQEAQAVGQSLFNELGGPHGVAGIFASGLIRTQETAAPFAGLEQMPVTDLSGLNEVNAGIFEGLPQGKDDLTGLLTFVAPIMWTLGQYWVPMPGSSDFNGMAFESRFSDAVQTMYGDAEANPVVSADGQVTDLAFSHELAIFTWTMMNVKNPDFSVILGEAEKTGGLLSNTGQVVLQGDPTDGWTLVSWDGIPVPQTPDLATGLFVDFRDLVTAPQMAAFNIQEALLTFDPTTIEDALKDCFDSVAKAIAQFPQAVIDTITGALHDGAATTGDTGAVAGDALSSLI